MAELWGQGVRGTALDVVSAWKEVLLLVAFVVLAWKVRGAPSVTVVDVLAGAYVLALVVYALLPQGWLGGSATTHGVLLAFRHDLLPVGGYAFGRLLGLVWQDPRRVGLLIALTATGVAVLGLLDVFFVPLQSWRDSGVPGWYRDQLSLDYRCLSYLPENWVLNTGSESNPIRHVASQWMPCSIYKRNDQ